MPDQIERQREISRTLVGVRRNAGSLPGFPGSMPSSLESAYRIQALSREAWPDQIIGWKVGGIPSQHREALGADYLCGPIFARRFAKPADVGRTLMPVFADGFAAVEPEFVLKLGETRGQDRLFIGVEIASSPLVAINDIGPLAVVCDFGNNNGLLVGAEIPDWANLGGHSFAVSTVIGDHCVGKKVVNNLPGNVTVARDFLFDFAEREKIELPADTYISTGAITGVHDANAGNRAVLDFGELGNLQLELVPEQPLA